MKMNPRPEEGGAGSGDAGRRSANPTSLTHAEQVAPVFTVWRKSLRRNPQSGHFVVWRLRHPAPKRRPKPLTDEQRDRRNALRRFRRANDPAYREKERARSRAHYAARTEAQREASRVRRRERYAANPEVRRAHNAVRRAILRGTLVRLPCEVCGDPRSEAHHPDHSKPLEVRFLCKLHHKAIHRGGACG